MENKDLLPKLQAIRADLIRELAYVNGKHDAIANELATINSLITDIDGFTEED